MPRTDSTLQTNLFWIFISTAVLETATCISRFVFGIVSTRDTAAIGQLTFGFRIHHGYIGLLLLPIAYFLKNKYPTTTRTLSITGWSFIASDLIHHFIVLWTATGDPSFDLWY